MNRNLISLSAAMAFFVLVPVQGRRIGATANPSATPSTHPSPTWRDLRFSPATGMSRLFETETGFLLLQDG